MRVLVLEDIEAKRNSVIALIRDINHDIEIDNVSNLCDYVREISLNKYDLIIVDLVVLGFPDESDPQDMTERIIENTRDGSCPNYKTTVIALTGYDSKAEENFKDLNLKDITVITFSEDSDDWKASLREKVINCIPPIHYDFVIICALPKEADGFADAGYAVGEIKLVGSLSGRELQIGNHLGIIVTAPRMGLVSSAITSTQAIERFKPKLICMSGICGGVDEQANIYDVVIPDVCHQHDSGKWTKNGFEAEIYSVQLDHTLRSKISTLISKQTFKKSIKKNVILNRNEFPEDTNTLDFDIVLAPTSSGSAVIEDKKQVKSITSQQRKLSAFEMESFAVYEAARLSDVKPQYFSAKAVVDNGIIKGDNFHRIASILSAKVVYELINSGLLDHLDNR